MANCRMATDEELIAACREGRTDAWNEVFERYHRLIASIARSYGATQHDAEEIVQITFGILANSIHKIAPDSRLAPWLATVARRHTWRLMAARRRETLVDDDGNASHDELREHEQRSAEEEVLRAALMKLPAKCRTLLETLYLRGDEPAYALVSAELDIPIGSIGPTRSRCLDKLRQLIAETDDARTQPTHLAQGGSV